MRTNILGIDHVVILVRDLDDAEATFTRLGFSLTPRGHHSIGTQNHCLMFEHDYLELLSVKQPHPVTQYFSQFLAASDGAAAIALSSDDAQSAYTSLCSDGVAADAPVDFSRPVELPGGSRDARFRVVQLPVDATPGCRTFLCQHFTPDVVWRPEYLKHAIGVTGIAGVSVLAGDPRGAAEAYARVLQSAAREDGDGVSVPVGDALLSFDRRATLQPRFAPTSLTPRPAPALAALRLRVRDRGRADETLRRGGFAPRRLADGALAIGADQAHGVSLIFE